MEKITKKVMKNRKFSPIRRKVVCHPFKKFLGNSSKYPLVTMRTHFTRGYYELYFFDIPTSWWEIKMIDFTEYTGFFSTFHLFNLLVGGQNLNFLTFRSLAERSVWLILLNIDFLTFQPLAGRSKWSILLNTVPFILSPPS